MKKFIPVSITAPFIEVVKEQRFLSGLMLFYLFSVIWGTYRFYSPIPQLDMWEGYLDFYLELLNGNSDIWWAQHNEHRPILSRLLFYFDLAFLGGESRLLIPLNVVLLFSIWYMMLLYADHFLNNKIDSKAYYFFLVLLTVFSLSWKQDENIIWAFQSQFWFACLLPLLGFFFLARSESEKKMERGYFVLAALSGVLSAGSMANGIFVLPLLTLMSLILRKRPIYSAILGLAAALVFVLYLYDYHTPAEHNSFFDKIIEKPWQSLVFFIEYVGVIPKNIYASFIFGLIHLYFIVTVIFNVQRHINNPLYVSVVAFLLYYLVTAVVTSGGRVDMGFNAALRGRYTTPAFMSLSLSLILYLYIKPQHIKYFGKRTVTIIAVLMLGTQIRTVIKNVDKIHDTRDREVMQMVMGTYSRESLKYGSDIVNYKKIENIASRAYYKNTSIFAREPFIGKREKVGKILDDKICHKLIHDNLSDRAVYMLSVNESIPVNEAVIITDKDKQVIGFGLPSRQYADSVSVILGDGQNERESGEVIVFRCE